MDVDNESKRGSEDITDDPSKKARTNDIAAEEGTNDVTDLTGTEGEDGSTAVSTVYEGTHDWMVDVAVNEQYFTPHFSSLGGLTEDEITLSKTPYKSYFAESDDEATSKDAAHDDISKFSKIVGRVTYRVSIDKELDGEQVKAIKENKANSRSRWLVHLSNLAE